MSTPEGYNAEDGTMDFPLALRQMRKGRKVRRRQWLPFGDWLEIKDGRICNQSGAAVIDLNEVTILAVDWEEVL